MKNFSAVLLTLAILLMTAGCVAQTKSNAEQYSYAAAGQWKDGDYTQIADGKNGTFDVTVIISDGKISEIKIGENRETPSKGGVAIAKLPDEIIKNQSVNVDAISGATVTSDAIKEAVAKCLDAASEN